MAQGRSEQAWGHTSAVLEMLFNLHRDPEKTAPALPGDFNPHRAGKERTGQGGPKMGKANISILKTVFVDRKGL